MKSQTLALRFLAVAFAGICLAPAQAAEKKIAGPNGGRILTKVEPRAEFFVLPDRKVQITFLDKAGKATPPNGQIVTVTAGERMSPKTLTFAQAGNTLISSAPLPAGDNVPAVVQIKPATGGSVATERFNVDLSKCDECKLSEYACTCAH